MALTNLLDIPRLINGEIKVTLITKAKRRGKDIFIIKTLPGSLRPRARDKAKIDFIIKRG
jgi:hypothetical protein